MLRWFFAVSTGQERFIPDGS